MGKVMIKILQGSAVTLTMLGGLTIHPPVANFLQCICAKNYENWPAVDKVIAKIIRLTFLAHPVHNFTFLVLVTTAINLHVHTSTYFSGKVCSCIAWNRHIASHNFGKKGFFWRGGGRGKEQIWEKLLTLLSYHKMTAY